MHIPPPFLPVSLVREGNDHRIGVLGRDIVLGPDSLPVSVTAAGREMLAGPVRLVGIEDGVPIIWDDRYPDNESACFIHSRGDDRAVLCGAMASPRFIADTVVTAEYDGCVTVDLRVMPRGKTVAQVFGLTEVKPIEYRLDRLWLEIPLKKEFAALYSMYPGSGILLGDGTGIPDAPTLTSGAVNEKDMALPFKALFWLGNDDAGLGFFAETDRHWQPEDKGRVIEVIHEDDRTVLRVRLLDSHPLSWKEDFREGSDAYLPVSFTFGLQPTPVKPFPRQPYPIRGLHLDCFVKVRGSYDQVLKNEYDRLKEKGVDTLILHEKWNKAQNWCEPSEASLEMVKEITSECHRRGIRVLTYFGYEISSLSPEWTDLRDRVRVMTDEGKQTGGWYRVPFQRDYVVCCGSEWADRFVDGVAKFMDTCHTDGVYLDSTSRPLYCCNETHGCGWRDENGALHGTYPVRAVREMFKKLYGAVKSRGGMINVHSFGYQNFTALPFIDLNWYGENLQLDYVKGRFGEISLDYFRAEYAGRNMGVPVEFIAYENRPVWTFENALALSMIHGILPRPNDLRGPLDLTAEVWRIFGRFPVDQSEWRPYWTNGAAASDSRVKLSYYRHTAPDGAVTLLALCANTSRDTVENVTFSLGEDAGLTRWTDLTEGGPMTGPITLGPWKYRIFLVR